MTVYREFLSATNNAPAICIIRSNSYGSTLKHFDKLFVLAQKTFPDLDRAKVEIKQYGGHRHKHTFGIEFRSPKNPGEGWCEITQMECTL